MSAGKFRFVSSLYHGHGGHGYGHGHGGYGHDHGHHGYSHGGRGHHGHY